MTKPDIHDADLLVRLTRRMRNHTAAWKLCRRPLCRRLHSCVGDPLDCVPRCAPDMTPEQRVVVQHDIKRMLQWRMAQVKNEVEMAAAQPANDPPPWSARAAARSAHAKRRGRKRDGQGRL